MNYVPKKGIRISKNDPDNSISLFDLNRINLYNPREPYLIAPDIIEERIDFYWDLYLQDLEMHPPTQEEIKKQ